jgi:serine/threonine-protein kinase 24/25/MST4
LKRPTAKELLRHPFIKKAKRTTYLVELIERYRDWKKPNGPGGNQTDSDGDSDTDEENETHLNDNDKWIETIREKKDKKKPSSDINSTVRTKNNNNNNSLNINDQSDYINDDYNNSNNELSQNMNRMKLEDKHLSTFYTNTTLESPQHDNSNVFNNNLILLFFVFV